MNILGNFICEDIIEIIISFIPIPERIHTLNDNFGFIRINRYLRNHYFLPRLSSGDLIYNINYKRRGNVRKETSKSYLFRTIQHNELLDHQKINNFGWDKFIDIILTIGYDNIGFTPSIGDDFFIPPFEQLKLIEHYLDPNYRDLLKFNGSHNSDLESIAQKTGFYHLVYWKHKNYNMRSGQLKAALLMAKK